MIDISGTGSSDWTDELVIDSQDRILLIARVIVDVNPGVAGVDTGMGLVRLLQDGAPDPSFGTNGNGVVYMPHSAFTASTEESGGLFWNIALQQDAGEEKIIVGAYSGDPTTGTGSDNLIARFTEAGQLDTASFGPDGQGGFRGYIRRSYSVVTDGLEDLLVLSDGRIVIAGIANPAADPPGNPPEDTFLARYSANGEYEDDFGDGDNALDEILGNWPNNGLRIALQVVEGTQRCMVDRRWPADGGRFASRRLLQ